MITDPGAQMIVAERLRQIDKGYNVTPRSWPWPADCWKPKPDDLIRLLTRAGAIYLADAERCQRIGDTDGMMVLRDKAARCAANINAFLKGQESSKDGVGEPARPTLRGGIPARDQP